MALLVVIYGGEEKWDGEMQMVNGLMADGVSCFWDFNIFIILKFLFVYNSGISY